MLFVLRHQLYQPLCLSSLASFRGYCLQDMSSHLIAYHFYFEKEPDGPLRLAIVLDIHEQSRLNVFCMDAPSGFLSEIKLAENKFHRWLT